MNDETLHAQFGGDISEVLAVDLGSRLGEFAKFLDRDEHAALEILAEISGLNFLPKFNISGEALKKIPHQLITEYRILPIGIDGNVLSIVVCWPLTDIQLEWITVATGYAVKCSLAYPEVIAKFIGESFGLLESAQNADDSQNCEDRENEDAIVIRFVNDLLKRCIDARATDIHFEPQRTSLMIRYRVDGDLVVARVPENLKKFQSAVIARLKIMARLNISEKRRPQDGKILFRMRDSNLDIRVSTLPTVYGESVSLRILSNSGGSIELNDLGLDRERRTLLLRALRRPHGIILVTGPTGAGKSTTLSACLRELRSPVRRLMTVEDPVEYEVHGVNQTQVNAGIGLTFASVLRSVLRQDPDVIMIGEIRDRETAEIAIRASITGHLVLSTLHTNDSIGAITRLRDIGVEEFLLSSAVRFIMAQRLVRKLCPHCAVEEEFGTIPKLEAEKMFGVDNLSSALMARGCDRCDGLGYRGQIGAFEVCAIDDAIHEAIIGHASESVIRAIAIKNGMLTLRDDLLNKIRNGITSLDEAVRIIED